MVKEKNMLCLERQVTSPDKRSPVTLASGKGEGPRETAGRSFRPKQSSKRKWRRKRKRREITKEHKHRKNTESSFGGRKHAQVHVPL